MTDEVSRIIQRSGMVLIALTLALLSQTSQSRARDGDRIEQGAYLARIGNCTSCHTNAGEPPFSGNVPLQTPFGTIYGANLTSDRTHGIGAWHADGFYTAMTTGRRPDGTRLYPAFPYTHFTVLTRADSDAIFAYLQTVPASATAVAPPQLSWPLNWRPLLAAWNLLNFAQHPFQPDTKKNADWNRGKYLIEGLGHCSLCHSEKNALGGEKGGADHFGGGVVEGWWAPALKPGPKSRGLTDWSSKDVASYLKTGRNSRTAAFGVMAQVVENSTQYLEDRDVAAVVTYLKDLPSSSEPPPQATQRADLVSGDATGRVIYQSACSACHGADGKGQSGRFGQVLGSGIVTAHDTSSLLRIILHGARSAATDANPVPFAMPPFGWKFSDDQVAAVANYVRQTYGNVQGGVTAGDVRKTR